MMEKIPFCFWPLRPALTILIFHRVLPEIDPLRAGEPDTKTFDRMMRFVSKNLSVLPLADAVSRLGDGSLPRRACCITFDDGYADNLTHALPILEKYRLPATVFVATGYLDGGRMFNDAIIDSLAATRKSELDLREIDLGVHSLGSLQEKRSAVQAILGNIKTRQPEARQGHVEKIIELAACGPLPTDIMLSSSQLRELSDRGVEIGGHTVAHTILTTLDDARALQEISAGKSQIEAITGRSVTSFAYPNGRPGRDYALRHVDLVREAGFRCAVTTGYGVGLQTTDVFQLPRFTPWARDSLKAAGQLLRNAWQPADSAGVAIA